MCVRLFGIGRVHLTQSDDYCEGVGVPSTAPMSVTSEPRIYAKTGPTPAPANIRDAAITEDLKAIATSSITRLVPWHRHGGPWPINISHEIEDLIWSSNSIRK